MSRGRVLVAMSGGVDSTVAAVLLQEAGYEVIGITLKTWDYASSGGQRKETGCCNLDSINDARQVAVERGFPHYIIDIRSEFGEFVIEDFISEYLAGRTPNPCVLCNTHIKWAALLRRARQMQCTHMATGHYAQLRQHGNRYVVAKGVDESKDQSYVLWGVAQEHLAMTLFPLGSYRKSQIRQLCLQWGYESLARKSESYEICFVPDNDYRGFLRRKVPGLDQQLAGGTFRDLSGRLLGGNEGYPFYTIGQRKGLGVATGQPMYVTAVDPEANTVTLGPADALMRTRLIARKINLQKMDRIPDGYRAHTKVRYRDPGTPSRLYQLDEQTVQVEFDQPVKAVAPGQSAVFYDGDELIGGGIIWEAT
ncbi:MAG: tRNA 2-thiouridine(34) synthase MnmA [Chitinophagales bacterium]|nr:tRNA 2-thiouridine(34) synthase MnmA [Chitinophagales bacterium]